MNIHLHIERLILDGLPVEAGLGAQLQAAFEAELVRLLADGGLSQELAGGGAVPSVRARAISLVAEGQPVPLGHQIARAVYGGIGNGVTQR